METHPARPGETYQGGKEATHAVRQGRPALLPQQEAEGDVLAGSLQGGHSKLAEHAAS